MFAVRRTITWARVRLAADKRHPRYTVLESATPCRVLCSRIVTGHRGSSGSENLAFENS